MVFRILIRILANNEQLVQRLSESYPMRKAAQIVVRAMYQGKNLIEESGLDKQLNAEQFRQAMKKFSLGLQKQVKQAHEDIKSRIRK